MKRTLALLLLASVFASRPYTVEALDADIAPHVEPALTKHFIALCFIPNQYNRIETQSLRLDEKTGAFVFKLRIAKRTENWDDSDTPSFITIYDDYTFEGVVRSANLKGGVLTLTIDGRSTLKAESLTFYGREKDSYISTLAFKDAVVYDTSREAREDDSALYFVGTRRRFTEEDLGGLSVDELGYLRNEFFARRGFIFKTDKMRSYFAAKPWYEASAAAVTLPAVESGNVEFIRGLEKRMAFGNNPSDIERINSLYAVAQRRLLTNDDLKGLSPFELPYLRNTFYARKGLVFYLLQYRDYFERQDWYEGRLKNVDHLLSAMDKENILVIQGLEGK